MARFIQSDGNCKGHPRTPLGTYRDTAAGTVGSPVLNEAQAIKYRAKLTPTASVVYTAPVFSVQPVSGYAKIGIAPTLMSIAASANGSLTYQWKKNTNTVLTGETNATYQPPASAVANLVASGATIDRFSCTATNHGASATSNEAPLVYVVSPFDASTPATPGTGAVWNLSMSADGQILVACTGDQKVWRSTDAGQSWSQLTTGGLNALNYYQSAMSDDGMVLHIAATGYGVRSSIDGGVTWKGLGPANQGISGIACSADGSKAIVSCSQTWSTNRKVMTTTNSGTTWTERGTAAYWLDCAVSADGAYGYAIEYTSKTIYRTSDFINFTAYQTGGTFDTYTSVTAYGSTGYIVTVSSTSNFITGSVSKNFGGVYYGVGQIRASTDMSIIRIMLRMASSEYAVIVSTDNGVTFRYESQIFPSAASPWYTMNRAGTKAVAWRMDVGGVLYKNY